MDRAQALARLDIIIDGIDRDELDRGGWWETSGGAEYGAGILDMLRSLVRDLTAAEDQ